MLFLINVNTSNYIIGWFEQVFINSINSMKYQGNSIYSNAFHANERKNVLKRMMYYHLVWCSKWDIQVIVLYFYWQVSVGKGFHRQHVSWTLRNHLVLFGCILDNYINLKIGIYFVCRVLTTNSKFIILWLSTPVEKAQKAWH